MATNASLSIYLSLSLILHDMLRSLVRSLREIYPTLILSDLTHGDHLLP